eukprot:8295596-Alexandrium_andersonii.AAC.1
MLPTSPAPRLRSPPSTDAAARRCHGGPLAGWLRCPPPSFRHWSLLRCREFTALPHRRRLDGQPGRAALRPVIGACCPTRGHRANKNAAFVK